MVGNRKRYKRITDSQLGEIVRLKSEIEIFQQPREPEPVAILPR
jgi:hypothetical protein